MNFATLNSRLIVTCADNILTFDHSGDSCVKVAGPDLPPNLTKGQLQVLNKEDRTITSVAVSSDNKYIAVSTENKQIVVYDKSLKVTRNLIVNRSASKILFTSGGDMLVADRTGDVYLYKFSDEKSEPILLLGHLSMILDMVLSPCGKYIITCDRDEKIRVSHFPNTYNIASYCLGHEEFVTCIKITGGILLSASGDGTVRLWNYLQGVQLNVIDTNQHVTDSNLLKQFSDTMDKEKIDVTALPITDMQVDKNNPCFIAVSVYSCDSIQLYKIEPDTYKWSFLKIIKVETLHMFYFFNNSLLIFNNFSAQMYTSSEFTPNENKQLDNFYKKYKNVLEITDNNFIMASYYKRKFDNVQEYLERKKLRLEANK